MSRVSAELALQVREEPSANPADQGTVADGTRIRHLTEIDLARRWRMSERTLQSWRLRKIGPPYLKTMGRVLYRLSDIETFEVEHLHRPQP